MGGWWIPAIGHSRSCQNPSRAEPQIRGTSPGSLRHMYTVRAPVTAGDPTERSHVQEQAQAGPGTGIDGSKVGVWRVLRKCFIFFSRGKMLLGYSDSELANMGGYDLVHYDDLAYVASAHQERKYNMKTKSNFDIHKYSLQLSPHLITFIQLHVH